MMRRMAKDLMSPEVRRLLMLETMALVMNELILGRMRVEIVETMKKLMLYEFSIHRSDRILIVIEWQGKYVSVCGIGFHRSSNSFAVWALLCLSRSPRHGRYLFIPQRLLLIWLCKSAKFRNFF